MKRLWVLWLLGGCVHPIEEDRSSVGEIVRDCRVPGDLGAPVSLEYPDGSLWIWDDASAFVTSADEVCATGPALRPGPLLLPTLEEQAGGVTLHPTGGFVHGGAGYLFFEQRAGDELLGTGMCVLPQGETTCVRQSASWSPEERVLNRGGVIDGDRALVYGCRRVAAFESPCVVSGAPLDRLGDPAAYQVWNVFSGWQDDLTSASAFADELGPVTVSPYEDGWLAVAADIFTGTFRVRRSSRAAADFGHAVELFSVPVSGFLVGGREHAGLRREPRTLHLTYASDGLHLVSFRFYGDFE